MLEKNEIQRLLDIAFLGFHTGKTLLARDIVKGLDHVLKESVELEICRAMGFFSVDRFEEARQVLESAEEKFTQSSMVKVYTALVDILEKKYQDAEAKLTRIIEIGDDPAAVRLGQTLLDGL